jgi:hypothetical protein
MQGMLRKNSIAVMALAILDVFAVVPVMPKSLGQKMAEFIIGPLPKTPHAAAVLLLKLLNKNEVRVLRPHPLL